MVNCTYASKERKTTNTTHAMNCTLINQQYSVIPGNDSIHIQLAMIQFQQTNEQYRN